MTKQALQHHSVEDPATWRREALPLNRIHARALWAFTGLDAVVGAGMTLVATGRVPCDDALCRLSTFQGRETVLGAMAFAAALLLLLLALATDGMNSTRAWNLPALYLLGGISLSVAGGALLTVALGLAVVTTIVAVATAVIGGGR